MQCGRLLVVDDNSSVENSLKKLLVERNFQIFSINSREEALHQISLSLYSAILWQMGKIDSSVVSFISEIRSFDENIPIIALTDTSDTTFLTHLFSLGVFSCLSSKPDPTELLEIIKAGLETFSEGEEIKIISAKNDWLEVVIPAKTNYIPRLSNYLSHLIVLPHRESQRLLYAFRELLQNAIEHGSNFCPAKKVWIRYLRMKKFLLFYIEDEGYGFNLSCLPHAAIGERRNSAMEVMQYRKQIGMRPGGLGIASALSIADEIHYNEKGNAVVMIKYISL